MTSEFYNFPISHDLNAYSLRYRDWEGMFGPEASLSTAEIMILL